jgi:hypothetical protein
LASKDIIPRHFVFEEGDGACEPPAESERHVVSGARGDSAAASSE